MTRGLEHGSGFPYSARTNAFSFLSSNMAKIYLEFCDNVSLHVNQGKVKAPLAALSAYADSQGLTGHAALDGLRELKTELNSDLLDARAFSMFYSFVHFICRERGQKSISVNTGVEAWKLVLTGRFRLLEHWCKFVKENQRYNISEDTWLQLLEFSRVVQEDLSNYDPEGAWPVLIDEFVEYMYSKSSSKDDQMLAGHSSRLDRLFSSITDDLSGMSMSSKSNILPGINASAGFKRKSSAPVDITPRETVDCISLRLASIPSPLFPKRPRLPYSSVGSQTTKEVAIETDKRNIETQELRQLNTFSLPLQSNSTQDRFGGSVCRNSGEIDFSQRTEQFQEQNFCLSASICGMDMFSSSS